jgi:hypothetical protein
MRTTLAIDDDVFSYARATAARERKPIGQVVSGLMRAGIGAQRSAGETRNGVPLLPRRSVPQPITMEFVNQLRDELP